jgi:hypothetical protein
MLSNRLRTPLRCPDGKLYALLEKRHHFWGIFRMNCCLVELVGLCCACVESYDDQDSLARKEGAHQNSMADR